MEAIFDPPGPGPWQQDQAHSPHGWSPLVAELYPENADRGFRETFARWGLLLDTLAWAIVEGFPYHQPVPFDLPGPDGPPSPEFIGAEIQRRTGVAAAAFDSKIWEGILDRWDNELKPAAIARHRELGDVSLADLEHDDLVSHLDECIEHVKNMAYLHHRFNGSALIPVADFVLHAGEWLAEPPTSLFGVYDGYSPASGVISPELEPAVAALRNDASSAELLTAGGDPDTTLGSLRASIPAVDEYVRSVGFRLVDGFDAANLTAVECPEVLLGRLAAGLEVDPTEARRRADEFGRSLRDRIAEEHLDAFDELLADGRVAYRLRDERGLYSDISAIGLLRWTLLEIGRRLHGKGSLEEVEHIFELNSSELQAVTSGANSPTASEIAARADRRRSIVAAGAPRYLGPPPPDPPPLDQLPPPLARVMGSLGFAIDGVLGQLEEPAGDEECVIGIPANAGTYEGKVCLVSSVLDLLNLESGDVLVAPTTGEAFNSMIHLLGAIVTDHGSFVSHAAIVARECGIPAVVGCTNATARLTNGQRVRVDGTTGEVHILR